MIITIDSTSRANFIRQMKQTRAYMQDNMNLYEMSGYNKVADNTHVNLVPAFTGKHRHEVPWTCDGMHRVPLVFREFYDRGYRTLHAEEEPFGQLFPGCPHTFDKAPSFDYTTRDLVNEMATYRPVWTDHTCIGTTSETEFHLNYVRDFVLKFRDVPHMSFFFSSRVTHGNMNGCSAYDPLYLEFMKKLRKAGVLNNTAVIFMGDHGLRFGWFRLTAVGYLEERLPYMGIVLPNWFTRKYPSAIRNLKLNYDRLTSHFDLHATLRDMISPLSEKDFTTKGLVSERGISLFREIPRERTCEDAAIDEHFCRCRNHTLIAVNDERVKLSISFIMRHLNKKVSVFKRCAQMFTTSVKTAKLVQDSTATTSSGRGNTSSKSVKEITLQLQFRTRPGAAIYEAFVRLSGDRNSNLAIRLISDVSRLSKYGDQIKCLEKSSFKESLKKYCYCM